VVGACIWVFSLVGVGFFLGELPFIQNNLTTVIFLIILLSISPALIEWLKVRFHKQ
jgi:membrane-associated protein